MNSWIFPPGPGGEQKTKQKTQQKQMNTGLRFVGLYLVANPLYLQNV